MRPYKNMLKKIPDKTIFQIFKDNSFDEYDKNSIELPIFLNEYILRMDKIRKERKQKINEILK